MNPYPLSQFYTYWTKLTFLILVLLGVFSQASGQTPGLIFQPASGTGRTVLDPNSDSYVSKSNTGYIGTVDIGAAANEIPYRLLPQFGSEPLTDLSTGSNGGHTDLAANPLYMAFNGTQVLFRVRLGGNSSASKGYSFLIDSDGVFNKQRLSNGTLIDYSTPSKVKNLGFEFEVVLALNFDVVIYRHRGSGDDNDPFTSNVIWRGSANGGYSQYFHKAIAASMEGGNADYFFDFYVPLTAFSRDGGTGISPTTPLRVTGSTVTSAQTGLEGTISDVGGVNDKLYNNDKYAIWRNIIPAFPSTTLNQIQAGDFCQTAAPAAPIITTAPITTASTVINGNSSINGGIISILRNEVPISTSSPVIVSNGTFSFALPNGITLLAGDVITARVSTAASENCPSSTSVSSNSVLVTNVVKGECAAVPPSAITLNQGSKSLNIITTYTGLTSSTLKVYRDGNILSGTVVATSTPTTYTFTPTTSTNQFAFAYDNSNSTSYGTLTATVVINGCESPRSASYYLNGNTISTSPTSSTTASPTINSNLICSTNTTLTGTAEPNSLIYLYIDNEPALQSSDGSIVASATASAATTAGGTGIWSISLRNFTITNGEILTVKAKAPGTISPSNPFKGLSPASQGITLGANCSTPQPTITPTTPCPTVTSISGSFITGATVVSGTTVAVFRQSGSSPNPITDTRVTEVVTVTGTSWTAQVLGNANLISGNIIYAVATAPEGRTASAPSATTQVASTSTAAALGLILSSPIKERATIITGTSTTNGTVNLYIDGQRIAGTATVSGATVSAPVTWSIAISAINQANLGAGTAVTASLTPSGGGCESQQTNAVTVSCVAPSSSPTLVTAAQTVCNNSAAILTINNTENGVIYQVYNGETATGPSMAGNGGTITISSGNLVNAAVLTIRAFQVGATECQTTLNGSTSITIAPAPTALAVSPTSLSVCNGASATITLSNTEENVSYQIQSQNSTTGAFINTGTVVTGTGGSISLTTGPLTSSGTFRVIGTLNGCTTPMGNTFAVIVPSNSLAVSPTAQSVCSGNTASVILSNSENGVSYQLQRGDGSNFVNSGSPVVGTGGNISLTTSTLSIAGTNTFRILATAGQCAPYALSQQVTVIVTSGTPTTFAVTPGSATVCSGQATTLTLAGSQVGISYQIFLGTAAIGGIVEGTGNALPLSSGPITTSGTYSIVASNNCGTRVTMGTTSITVNPTPAAFAVTPTTQTICNNATASITLVGSQSNVTYQLQVYNPATGIYSNTGASVAGTGNALVLTTGALTANANLKVVATNATGCSTDMSNRVFVAVPASNLTVSAVTPTVCANSTSQVRIVASETEVYYQLFVGSTAVGTLVEGTGGDIILASNVLTASTTFTVRATPSSPAGCTFQVGSPITINVAAPIVQTSVLSTSSSICKGATASILLNSSQMGITYQIYNGTTPSGFGVTGTGSAITLTSDPLASNATLQVFAISPGCSNTAMSSSYPIAVSDLPIQYSFATSQKIIRSEGTITMELPISQNGVEYQIFNGSSPSGHRIMGTGNAITLTSGAISSATTLTIQAIGTGGCGNTTMNGFTSVSIDAAPLPVSLSVFTARNGANGVELKWSTVSEKDNHYFEVERSLDTKVFVNIGQVQGNGTSNLVHHYSFTDATAPSKTVYYRLKQVDFDGTAEYSKVIALKAQGKSSIKPLMIANPNPFNETLGVSLSTSGLTEVQLELYDLNQKLIIKELVKVSGGKASLKSDLTYIANGVYFLKIKGALFTETVKVIKTR